MTASVSPKQSPDLADGAAVTLLGGLAPGGFDSLLPGGVYAVVPQAPPARYPLWALFLPTAVQTGRVCHVLTRSDPAEFLNRVQHAGWPQATDAWAGESLRLYAMADGFSKLLFRRDVTGLATELVYWGVKPGDCLLVDAADALLSLHDLFLATAQLSKLRAWAKEMQISMLLNFTLAGAGIEQAALTSLMDHFSGMARLRSDESGPSVTLEYWRSGLGTSAERTVWLQERGGAYQLRPSVVDGAQSESATLKSDMDAKAGSADRQVWCGTNDPVWSHELQMLMQSNWQTFSSTRDIMTSLGDGRTVLAVLRFDAHAALANLARDVHSLRSTLGVRARIVVAEHRVSLRYANELVLLRLGADTVIRKDVPLSRWPNVLDGIHSLPIRPQPDLDADIALANAAMPQGRGYLLVPAFLQEVRAAIDRGSMLGVPFALGVLKIRSDRSIGDAVAQAEFRRNGDFVSSDGEKLYLLFNACSFTRGPDVVKGLFVNGLSEYCTGVDWMASQLDIQHCIEQLTLRHEAHPIDILPQGATIPPDIVQPSESESALKEDACELAGNLSDSCTTVENEVNNEATEPLSLAPLDALQTAPIEGACMTGVSPAPDAPSDSMLPDELSTGATDVPDASDSHWATDMSPANDSLETIDIDGSNADHVELSSIANSADEVDPPFKAVRVTAVVPHVPGQQSLLGAMGDWGYDSASEMEKSLIEDTAELGLDKRAISSSVADVNALFRRLARPAPTRPDDSQSPRQSGLY